MLAIKQQSGGKETASQQCPWCWAEELDADFSLCSQQCSQTQLELGGWKSQVCTLSLLQAGMDSHPPKKRSQLSLAPGCQRPFPKPCSCHSPHSALAQSHKSWASEQGGQRMPWGWSWSALPEQRGCFPWGHFVFTLFVSLGPSCLATG